MTPKPTLSHDLGNNIRGERPEEIYMCIHDGGFNFIELQLESGKTVVLQIRYKPTLELFERLLAGQDRLNRLIYEEERRDDRNRKDSRPVS